MPRRKIPKTPPPPIPEFVAQLTVRAETPADSAWIDGLHRQSFGPGRFARTAFRVRERVDPDPKLSFLALFEGHRVASVKMTPIAVGGAPGYLLGPLMTDPAHRSKGAGRHLVQKAIAAAKAAKAEFVLLVGDEPYYGALGFKQVPPGDIVFPGPVDPARILVHAEPDAIGRIKGMVGPRR